MSVHDFEPKEIIGRGAFGEVRVCQQKKTGEYVAVKKMLKNDMTKKSLSVEIKSIRIKGARKDKLKRFFVFNITYKIQLITTKKKNTIL